MKLYLGEWCKCEGALSHHFVASNFSKMNNYMLAVAICYADSLCCI